LQKNIGKLEVFAEVLQKVERKTKP